LATYQKKPFTFFAIQGNKNIKTQNVFQVGIAESFTCAYYILRQLRESRGNLYVYLLCTAHSSHANGMQENFFYCTLHSKCSLTFLPHAVGTHTPTAPPLPIPFTAAFIHIASLDHIHAFHKSKLFLP